MDRYYEIQHRFVGRRVITFKASEELEWRLKLAARLLGIHVSEFIRSAVLEKLDKLGLLEIPAPQTPTPKVLKVLG